MENGGVHLYGFVRNEPLARTDWLGMVPTFRFFADGVLDVLFSDVPDLGHDRKITLTFILIPAAQACCRKIDFLQTYVNTNLEGPETKGYGFGPTSFIWDPNRFLMTGVKYVDLGDYYLKAGGAGKYLSSYASYMHDLPFDGDPYPDIGMWYETAGGAWVRRKTRVDFKTCATCIEGELEGEVYGCVKWKLDHPNTAGATPASLSIEGFCDK